MAFIDYTVQELSEDLKIEDSVIAYAEAQFGPMRNERYMQRIKRVRLGLQTSPENFFYDETAFDGAQYVNLNALESPPWLVMPKPWHTTPPAPRCCRCRWSC